MMSIFFIVVSACLFALAILLGQFGVHNISYTVAGLVFIASGLFAIAGVLA